MAYKLDNTRAWIAPYGHDVYGDGPKEYPFATIDAAKDLNLSINCVTGVYYNQTVSATLIKLYSEGVSQFINTIFPKPNFLTNGFGNLEGVTLINYGKISPTNYSLNNGLVENALVSPTAGNATLINVLVKNLGLAESNVKSDNCTIHAKSLEVKNQHKSSNIIAEDFIDFNLQSAAQNSTFSAFTAPIIKANGVNVDFSGASTPTQRVERIRTELVNQYGGTAQDYLQGCLAFLSSADLLLNSIEGGDYTLKPTSPLAFANQFSGFIGKYDISIKSFANVDGSAASNLPTAGFIGDFVASSAVNITYNQASGQEHEHYFTLTDPALPGSIEEKPFYVDRIRALSLLTNQYADASRNATSVDSTPFFGALIDLAYNALTFRYEYNSIEEHRIYQVVGGSVEYNGLVYTGGTYIIGVADQTLAYSSDIDAKLRPSTQKTDDSPHRNTMLLRTSKGGLTLDSAQTLTANYYYYVVEGTGTYDGNSIAPNTFLITNTETTFTGTAKLMEVYAVAEPYRDFENETVTTVNTVGNVPGAALSKTNGEDDYDYAQNQPNFAKFIQRKLVFDTNTLPASL